MEKRSGTEDVQSYTEFDIKPYLTIWNTTAMEDALKNLLKSMRCSEENCDEPAAKMYYIDDMKKDLKCTDHLFSLKVNKMAYRDIMMFWSDIESTLQNIKREISQAQVLISTMESGKFKKFLPDELKKNLEDFREKLLKIMNEFEKKILDARRVDNFDIFSFLFQQTNMIEKKIQDLYKMIGPFLSETYSACMLDRVMIAEVQEQKALEAQQNSRRTTMLDRDELDEEEEKIVTTTKSNNNHPEEYKKRDSEVTQAQTQFMTSMANSSQAEDSKADPDSEEEADIENFSKLGKITLTNTQKRRGSADNVEDKFYDIVTVF